MPSTWKKLSEKGIMPGMDVQLSKRVRIVNQLSASLSVIATFYCFVFYFAGFKREGIGVIGVVAAILFPLLWNHYKAYTFARLWFIGAINGAVIVFSYLFGRETGIQYVFFPAACLPWLFFAVSERLNIIFGMLVPLGALLLFYSGSGEPMVDISLPVQHGIRASILIAVFVIFALCMLFFAMQNDKAEQNLLSANKLLQAGKEELESQQEELRQINEELTHQAEELKASEEELRTQEEELRQINSELEEKNELIEMARKTLDDKARELEISGRYKSEFLANMSHELRTPLNSILILANLLKQDKFKNLNEKQIEYATIIHKSGSDLLNLINDILDLSKIEAGKVDFVYEQVAVQSIAQDMQQLFAVLAADKKINLTVTVQEGVPQTIVTDRQRIEQVVKNLMSNAFKFTPERGTVSLDFRMLLGNLAISVTDTGIGIAVDKVDHIFEAFRQADGSTSRKFGGTGLGLSISRELMKRLGGTIKVTSTPGEGSVFTLSLPLSSSARPAGGPAGTLPAIEYKQADINEQTSVKDDRSVVNPGQQSILIIEDDLVFATYVRDFAHDKGYKTIVALSGDEGLHYARKYKPSAIILDLGLPVIDGHNLLKIFKSDDELRDIPVHVVSASDREDVSAIGMESYLRKPLQDKDLERAFTDIGTYIGSRYRSILIYSVGAAGMQSMFEKLSAERKKEVVFEVVGDMAAAKLALSNRKTDCIIADIGHQVEQGADALRQLKELAGPGVYIITCLDGNISGSEERTLKTYSDSIIRKSPHYAGRLLDEVALFLHNLKKPARAMAPPQYDHTADKGLKGRKVLLADDDMRNIFSVTALLEDHGMNVLTAEHGREALDVLEQNADVDIILMDIMMPEMDGYEAMQHIRANERFRKIPIIALTAKAMAGDREKCLEAGASDYITKPIDGNKLFSLMRVWLS